MLAHVASDQGIIAVENIMGKIRKWIIKLYQLVCILNQS